MSNIPKLRFPEFKGEWEEKKLNSIFTKITQRNSDNQNSNVITNSATEGLVSQRDYFDKDIANKDKTDNYFIIKNGDFVYNPRKSSAAPYGPFTQYKLLDDGIVSPLYLCLRKNNSEVESKYLENYFKTTCWHQYIYENGSSGARHDRVSIHDDVLLAMPIKVPSLPEQQKIADFLSNVDSIITAETKILKTLQKKKKALMQKLFTQQLRFKSADGTDFPAWEDSTLEKECDYVDYRGKTPKKVSTGIFLVTAKNIKLGYIDYECSKEYIAENDYNEVMHRGKVKLGDVLITTEAPCGNVAQIDNENVALAQRVIKYSSKGRLNNTFLKYYFLSDLFRTIINEKATGSTVKGIKGSVLHKQKVIVPSLEEQQKIADCLSSLDSLIQTQQKVVTTWQQRKKALLQQMFI